MRRAVRQRITLMLFIFCLAFALLLGRLAFIQLYHGSQLAQTALNTQTRFFPAVQYSRGYILDRTGESLTDSRMRPALVLFPNMLVGKEVDLGRLAGIITLSQEQVINSLNRGEGLPAGRPVIIKYGLSVAEQEAIKALSLPGVYILPMEERYGPESLAVHLVGHLDGEGRGRKGIELLYDRYLHQSQPARYWPVVLDARGNVVPGLSFQQVKQNEQGQGSNVILTIDKGIQRAVERVMDRRIAKGAVVVLDITTGHVLAMASRPTFNQNAVTNSRRDNGEAQFLNRAVEHFYPGSIFKLVVAAAALEEGLVSLEEEFFCSGKYVFDTGLSMSCWREDGHGKLSFQEALALSCNPTFIEVGLRVGRENLVKYAGKLGLTRNTLIGYPLADYPSIRIDKYGPGKIANASLGQEGIRLSPLQVSSLIATIANNGKYISPKVVQAIEADNGEIVRTFAQEPSVQVIAPETAQKLKQMLTAVTLWGTGKAAWIPSLGTAGKTSTAETGRVDAENRKVVNAWFAGYVPLDEPRYAVTIFIEDGISGGSQAAPVFREIVKEIYKHPGE